MLGPFSHHFPRVLRVVVGAMMLATPGRDREEGDQDVCCDWVLALVCFLLGLGFRAYGCC